MERKVIISKRFGNNTLRVYQYLLKEFSVPTAYRFLDRLEKRIDFIANNPTIGKLSAKRKNVRSVLFTPHNQIFYRYQSHINHGAKSPGTLSPASIIRFLHD